MSAVRITVTIPTATDPDAESLAVRIVEALEDLGHKATAHIHDGDRDAS